MFLVTVTRPGEDPVEYQAAREPAIRTETGPGSRLLACFITTDGRLVRVPAEQADWAEPLAYADPEPAEVETDNPDTSE